MAKITAYLAAMLALWEEQICSTVYDNFIVDDNSLIFKEDSKHRIVPLPCRAIAGR